MDLNELVSQIAERVAEKISAMEEKAAIDELSCKESINKPKLLIISEDIIPEGSCTWKDEKVIQEFDVTYGLNKEYPCDVQPFDVIVLQNLSNVSLGKIAEGTADTPFTELVMKSILLGKKIIISNEGVEIFKYKESAPKLYYGMMMQKIEFLKNTGIEFGGSEQLINFIGSKECVAEKTCCSKTEEVQSKVVAPEAVEPEVVTPEASIKIIAVSKRVVTEHDVRIAYEQHADQICITERTIITDLAREYAEQRDISFKIN